MEFSIISTENEHLDDILFLNESSLPAVSSVNMNEMKKFLNIADYFKSVLVNKVVSGFLIALQPGKDYQSVNYKWFEKRYKSFLYVDRIVIASKYQGCGIGRSFYNDLELFASNKTDTITCEVNIKPKNTGSIIFHKKFGFHQVGTQSTDKGEKEVSLMEYLITKR